MRKAPKRTNKKEIAKFNSASTKAAAQVICAAAFYLSGHEFVIKSEEKDKQYNHRQDIGYISSCPFTQLASLSGIYLSNEVFPAPAIASGTKEDIDKAADGQKQVTQEEVFQIENRSPERLQPRPCPLIKAEDTGHAQYGHRQKIEQG